MKWKKNKKQEMKGVNMSDIRYQYSAPATELAVAHH